MELEPEPVETIEQVVDRLIEASDLAAHMIMNRIVALVREPVTGNIYEQLEDGTIQDPRDFARGEDW
jgi:hypothetical protein